MSGLFAPARRKTSKARVAIAGPSGSGKTWSALEIATGLADGGRIAVVDTEHGSASLYAGDFHFDVAEMQPPYMPGKYLKAINEAAASGYDVIILDSLTHAWKGAGGVLDVVDQEKARDKSGGGFSAWKTGDKLWRELLDGLIAAPIHVIATMRSKQEYVQERDDRGKTVIRKVGMAPEARDGIEFEFTLVIDMDQSHTAVVTKSRCRPLADAVIERPDSGVGKQLLAWLNNDDDQPAVAAVPPGPITDEQMADLQHLLANAEHPIKERTGLLTRYGVHSLEELTYDQAEAEVARLTRKDSARKVEEAEALRLVPEGDDAA